MLFSEITQGEFFYPLLDFSVHELVQVQKLQELQDIRDYAQTGYCYMRYLVTYLGDEEANNCGVCGICQREHFPLVRPPERIQVSVTHFLEQEYIPLIEGCAINTMAVHEAGWALSYHGTSYIGKLVSLSRTLLLIDDIYDSGYTLQEAGKMLMQAGAKAVYPLTITRTYHSDNQ